jgi:F-type H+-transporting ATPase subunit gamma
MANLRDLRKRRKSAASTKKITRTMELVASSKLQKAQNAAIASRPYAEGLRELVSGLASGQPKGSAAHPLMAKRPVKTVAIVLCCSDRGLCGSFNANLINLALKRADEWKAKGAKVEFISVGKKGASTLAFFGAKPIASHVKVAGSPTFPLAEKIAQTLMDRFLANQADLIEVVYARFVSTTRQVPDVYAVLPAGAGDEAQAKPAKGPKPDFFYEPEPEELLAALIPQTVKTAFFSALLQTAAAEHAARRIAMKNASDAASDMVKFITRDYNRGRQGKITQEIAEIVGAVEAMA